MKNKISIIIPFYNSEKYLDRCIKSILNQTYENLEIILVDDGSTDNSLKLCHKYKMKDKRVFVYHKKNEGVSSARNFGLEKATGMYIAFVDSDDYLENDMYELMFKNLIENKSDIAICNIYLEDLNKKILFNYRAKDMMFFKDKYPTYSYYNPSISGYVCNKLYVRKVIYSLKNSYIKFNSNITIAEDDLFNYEIILNNSQLKYTYIDKKLYHYILNGDSVTSKTYNEKKLTYFDAKEKEIDILNHIGISSDFLKADYIINYVRTKIIMEKLKLKSTDKYESIKKKSNLYKKEVKYCNLNFNLKIKLFVVTKIPLIYKIKLKNKYN